MLEHLDPIPDLNYQEEHLLEASFLITIPQNS